jgi:hypothetical protein
MISLSGGGNFLVIRATGTDAYDEYIYNLGKVQSAATLIITSREGSNSHFVKKIIAQAEALFIAGSFLFSSPTNEKKNQRQRTHSAHFAQVVTKAPTLNCGTTLVCNSRFSRWCRRVSQLVNFTVFLAAVILNEVLSIFLRRNECWASRPW